MSDSEEPEVGRARAVIPWCPTATAGKRFFRLPTAEQPEGCVYGIDAASSVSGDQTGMRQIGYGTWVSVHATVFDIHVSQILCRTSARFV